MSNDIYTVKNVKRFRGHDGDGFNATLYRNNKRVALVDDDAHGGEFRFHWLDYEAERVTVSRRDYKDNIIKTKGTPEEAKAEAHIIDKTYESEYSDKTMYLNLDIFISGLVEEVENARRIKRLCKKKTLFRLKDDTYQDGEWLSLNIPTADPRGKEYLENKYGDKIAEVMEA